MKARVALKLAQRTLSLNGVKAHTAQADILRKCGAIRRLFSYGGPRRLNRNQRILFKQLAASYEKTANLINQIPLSKKSIFEQVLPTPYDEYWDWQDEAKRLKTLGSALWEVADPKNTRKGRSGEDNERLRIVARNAYDIWTKHKGSPPGRRGRGYAIKFQDFVRALYVLSGGRRRNIGDIRSAVESALKSL